MNGSANERIGESPPGETLRALCACRPFRRLLCWRAPRSARKVAVTFDDGPNEQTTPKVLAILKEAGVRCTFFVLGREVVKLPGLTRAVAAAGHEIAIHGFDHSGDDVFGQIVRCEAELKELGLCACLFRPALGRRGLVSLPRILWRGYATVLWSFDAHDSMRHEGKWAGPAPDYGRIRGGDIVLMHDDNPVCVAELPGLIESLRARGLEPVTVSELW